MNVYEIVGIRPYSFNDEKTGKVVSGRNLFVTTPLEGENCIGVSAEKLSLSDQAWEAACAAFGFEPQYGDRLLVSMNKYGRVDAFIPVPPVSSDLPNAVK